MARIKRIGIAQTTKFFVVFYLIATSIFMIPMFVLTTLLGSLDNEGFGPFRIFGGVFILLVPVFYALLGGFMVALMSFFYNLIAKFIGGVEIEIEKNNKSDT